MKKVVTTVRGDVPLARREEFEASYTPEKGAELPPGLEISLLLRSSGEAGTYVIETVWSSREALEAMRGSGKPRAVALFEKVGVSPTIEIHEVAGSVP